MSYHYHPPLDPECPDVSEFYESHMDDPISQMCGCMEEITQGFESNHRKECKRCLEYGVANIEVID